MQLSFKPISNIPCAHLFVLVIYAAHSIQTSYFTPNTLCRAHNLMSHHTYKDQNHNAATSKTCHFDTYPNPTIPCLFILIQLNSLPPQTCKRSFKLISSDTTFAHLFVLIIFEPISHIYATHATQTSYFIPKTF